MVNKRIYEDKIFFLSLSAGIGVILISLGLFIENLSFLIKGLLIAYGSRKLIHSFFQARDCTKNYKKYSKDINL